MRANRVASRLLICGSFLAVSAWAQSGDFENLLHQGFALHQQQRYSEALPVLRQAWKIEPRDYFANLLMGIDLVRTGERAQAVGFLKTAARLRPQEEFPHEYLGEAQAGIKRYAEAVEAYSQAVKMAPQSSQAAIAMVEYSLTRFAQISSMLRGSKKGLAAEYRVEALSHPLMDADRRKLLRRSVEIDNTNAEAWSDLALADLAGGDQAAGEIDVKRAIELDANNLAAWIVEAVIAAQKNDWQETARRLNDTGQRSRTALANAISYWPQSLQPPSPGNVSGTATAFLDCVRTNCGAEKLLAQLPPQWFAVKMSAEEIFHEQRWEQVVASPKPMKAQKDSWYRRGSALAHLGDCERAAPALERSLKDDAQNVESLYRLSLCYAELAGLTAERFQQSGGEDDVVHTMRGDVLLRLQADGAAAIVEYQAALNTHPSDPRTLEHLAEAQFSAGQYDAARASAQAVLSRDPHRGSAQRTMVKIAMQDRDYVTALPLLRELAARDPHDLAVRVDLATALSHSGALAEALQNLTPALNAGYPDEKGALHYLLGTILRDLNRGSESKAAFATARQLSDAYQQLSRGDHDAK